MRRRRLLAAIGLVIGAGAACNSVPPPAPPAVAPTPAATPSTTRTFASVEDWYTQTAVGVIGPVQSAAYQASRSGTDLVSARPSCVVLAAAVANAVDFDTTAPVPDAALHRLWKDYLQAEADRAAACLAAADAETAYDADPPGEPLEAARARLHAADLGLEASKAAARSAELYQQFLARLLAVR